MGKEQPIPASRKKDRLFIFLIAAVLLVLFVRLFMVLQDSFADVDKRLKDGTMVNLNAKDPARLAWQKMLQKGYYFDDQAGYRPDRKRPSLAGTRRWCEIRQYRRVK